MTDRGTRALAQAFFELLTEEQEAAAQQMVHRANPYPRSAYQLVDRVFLHVGPRAMAILSRPPAGVVPVAEAPDEGDLGATAEPSPSGGEA